MSTTYDKDLNDVLAKATNEELTVPHDIIVKKLSELMTIEEVYKEHYPDHSKYPDLMAKELRAFGGHTFVNVFRGGGPSWYEVVCDVARKVKAPFGEGQSIADVEASILATILSKAFEKMSEEERMVVINEIRKSNKSWAGGVSAAMFLALFKVGGFASYKLMLIVTNGLVTQLLGRGLPFVVNTALTRTMGVASGPIGWGLNALLLAYEAGAPSYKVTVPCVAYVGMLRAKQQMMRCEKCGALLNQSFAFCPECGTKTDGREADSRPSSAS
ncbi:MAG: hypothetical protein OXU77_21085 [Gammaproteobacteria bacterium]|nr:hypothetical protein [Gammaproteobacteria bacterium]MDE0040026.1 hypothetical protein [Gammaproteobacteria bacterium]